jgi:hypothetical protein
MSYVPPSGWIERIDEHTDALTRVSARFHSRHDCGPIKNPRALVQVDKPYHAAVALAAPGSKRGGFVAPCGAVIGSTVANTPRIAPDPAPPKG